MPGARGTTARLCRTDMRQSVVLCRGAKHPQLSVSDGSQPHGGHEWAAPKNLGAASSPKSQAFGVIRRCASAQQDAEPIGPASS